MPLSPTPTFVNPTPANLAKATVEEFAARVADRVGYSPGVDLEPIVARIGGKIQYEGWDYSDNDGSLEVYPGGSPAFIIRLTSFAGHLRNRFTIAHELGHYFLHSRGGNQPIKVARAGSGRVEWEANWFAGAFLLPEKTFRADWQKYGQNIAKIVDAYKVSEAVVEIRLENLGMK